MVSERVMRKVAAILMIFQLLGIAWEVKVVVDVIQVKDRLEKDKRRVEELVLQLRKQRKSCCDNDGPEYMRCVKEDK